MPKASFLAHSPPPGASHSPRTVHGRAPVRVVATEGRIEVDGPVHGESNVLVMSTIRQNLNVVFNAFDLLDLEDHLFRRILQRGPRSITLQDHNDPGLPLLQAEGDVIKDPEVVQCQDLLLDLIDQPVKCFLVGLLLCRDRSEGHQRGHQQCAEDFSMFVLSHFTLPSLTAGPPVSGPGRYSTYRRRFSTCRRCPWSTKPDKIRPREQALHRPVWVTEQRKTAPVPQSSSVP